MLATSETGDPTMSAEVDARRGGRHSRAWRYAPLVVWAGWVLFASTGAMSAANTSRVIEPLLRWLSPGITEARIDAVHFIVRKCAHFTEYALLALLAARAFLPSTKKFLRRHWIAAALIVVVSVSLIDEFNQSFNPARTGTIRDSALDTFGGLTALAVLAYLRARRARHAANL
ncbi:MAG: VanZ family protein [Pyrinomonadaceae bacterium]